MYTLPTFKSDRAASAPFAQARGNALASLADGRARWLLVIDGADAYVSADWYLSPDHAPSWLHRAVPGTVERMPERPMRQLFENELERSAP